MLKIRRLLILMSNDKLAAVGTPGSVDFHVPVEVARLGEAQHAQLALVRLLSAVYPHVLRQRRRVRERLPAHLAPSGVENFLYFFFQN